MNRLCTFTRRLRAAGLLALAACLSCAAQAHSPSVEAAVPTASAAPAPVEKLDMGSRVAACTTCHGRDGQATNSGYFPRIAGKPAGYLYEQLRNFRDGRRQQPAMNHLLRTLSDAYLREMADYFANLQYPYPPPTTSDLSPEQLARGRSLVMDGDPARGLPACASCHGAALTGVQPGIPGLLGLPRLYIAAQLGAWLTAERRALPPDCMADVGRRLNSADIQAVAGWLAAQPMPTQSQAVAALPHPLPQPCSMQGDVAHGGAR